MAITPITIESKKGLEGTELICRCNSLESQRANFIDMIEQALAEDPSITRLNLDGNSFINKDKIITRITTTLLKHPQVTALTLNYTCLGWKYPGDDEADMPLFPPALKELSLKANSFKDVDARSIAGWLTNNSTLMHLNLQGNETGDNGANALAEALKVNSTLTYLNLLGNQIGSAGASALAMTLTANLTLTHLDLQHNKIGDNGAIAFAEALKVNSALIILKLEGNQIGDEGACALASGFTRNSTLTHMDLEYNRIRDNGANALAGALKVNSILTHLNLQSNRIDVHLLKRIHSIPKRNRHNAAMRLPLEVRCIRYFAKLVFDSYSDENKEKVYYQIWDHSGRPDQSQFGERKVFKVDWSIFLTSVAEAGFDLKKEVELYLEQARGGPSYFARYESLSCFARYLGEP